MASAGAHHANALSVYTVTFNAARALVDPLLLGRHFFDALPPESAAAAPPDVIVVALQELSPIAYSFLGGSYLAPYLDRVAQSVHVAAGRHGGAEYRTVAAQNLGMTAIMLFARPAVAAAISRVETAGTGVGLWEMGNKGAVGVRVAIAPRNETDHDALQATFVAAHLAPMEGACERRNADWQAILRNLVFEPTTRSSTGTSTGTGTGTGTAPSIDAGSSEQDALLPSSPSPQGLYAPTTHIFLAGDLNYRTHATPPTPHDHHAFPQPVPDPNHPTHFSQHLPLDQLTRERAAGRVLQGFAEAPITFPPTYKYSNARGPSAGVGAGDGDEADERWAWAKHRWPSWCDRILWLSDSVSPVRYTALPLLPSSDHRPVALYSTIALKPVRAADADADAEDLRNNPPYPINPAWKQQRQAARMREVIVGVLAYLALMREGQVLLVGLLAGAVGVAFVVRSFL